MHAHTSLPPLYSVALALVLSLLSLPTGGVPIAAYAAGTAGAAAGATCAAAVGRSSVRRVRRIGARAAA